MASIDTHIDPHAKVTSAEQDDWCQISEQFRNHVRRLLMTPGLTPEHLCCTLHYAVEVRAFEGMCQLFDVEVESLRAQHRAKAEGCEHA